MNNIWEKFSSFSKETKTYQFITVDCSECGQIYHKENASSSDKSEAEKVLDAHVVSNKCGGAVSYSEDEYTN